ncbi:MAG: histidine phosphatase family protein [Actinobacteria bacterium]|jgi:broad specificity phosphatase PhoE|nr:histidine phosphatase family protein [Actinomycetota bacterium]
MAERLLLVRHAACEGGGAGRLLGRSDPPLAAPGRAQARALRALVAREEGARFESSPLRRARETAQLALSGDGRRAVVEESLREIDFGSWEGLTFAEVWRRDPELAERWATWVPDFAFPGGEDLRGFIDRIAELARRLAADPARTVVAFTHGGVIQFLLCHLLGLAPRSHLAFEICNAAVATVRLDGERGVLCGLCASGPLGDERGGRGDG